MEKKHNLFDVKFKQYYKEFEDFMGRDVGPGPGSINIREPDYDPNAAFRSIKGNSKIRTNLPKGERKIGEPNMN